MLYQYSDVGVSYRYGPNGPEVVKTLQRGLALKVMGDMKSFGHASPALEVKSSGNSFVN